MRKGRKKININLKQLAIEVSSSLLIEGIPFTTRAYQGALPNVG